MLSHSILASLFYIRFGKKRVTAEIKVWTINHNFKNLLVNIAHIIKKTTKYLQNPIHSVKDSMKEHAEILQIISVEYKQIRM